jgi:ComF family protein
MLKFQQKLHLVDPLSRLLIRRIGERVVRPDILIPVPLHPSRLQRRGFNQSVELSKVLAKHYHLSYDWHICRRIKQTKAQSELRGDERRRNLSNAFQVCADIKGAHLVVVDDVITTGATVTELSKALNRAGAKRVDVWAIARTTKS